MEARTRCNEGPSWTVRPRVLIACAASALALLACGHGLSNDPDPTIRNSSRRKIDSGTEPASTPPQPESLRCGPSDPFGDARAVEGLPQDSMQLRFSDDELTVHFAQLSPKDSWDILTASRESLVAPFSSFERLPASSPHYDFSPTLPSDELSLFIESNRDGAFHIYRADRSSVHEPFGAAQLLPNVSDRRQAAFQEGGPFVLPDGSALYVHASPLGAPGRLHRSARVDGEFAPPLDMMIRVDVSNGFPVVTRDERVIYFAGTDADGDADIWMATRDAGSDRATGFSNAEELISLNGASQDVPSWVSLDGCRLYFSRSPVAFNGDSTVMVVERVPLASSPE